MSKVYLDTETCGLHSMMVLLQYAVDDGPINLHEVWRRPIRETLALIEWICQHTVIGFNLAFDWFHIVKTYTIFRLCDPDWIPAEHIDEIAMLEPQGQDGPCVKPACALDLMLHSRKGPYQSLMAREDIRIKRVPSALAYALAAELEGRVQLDNIYFARSADPNAPKWHVFDRKDRYGDLDTDFKDVVLRFNPAGGLKFLAEHAMGFKPKFHFKDVEPPTAWRPYELGYAPTALAVSSPEKHWEVWGKTKGKKVKTAEEEVLTDPALNLDDEHDDEEVLARLREEARMKAEGFSLLGRAWPGVIEKHIEHWATRADARVYANDDIIYTRALDKHFEYPPPGDNDSALACMVPVVRWHGFAINKPGMDELLAKAEAVLAASPVNINKPGEVRAYITAAMDSTEAVVLEESTKKANLEAVKNWEIAEPEPCGRCEGTPGCARCGGTGEALARPASGRSSFGANPGREVCRQGKGAVQEAPLGRQVPRQLRGDRCVVQPHGRGRRSQSPGHQARQVRANDVPFVLGRHDPLRRRLRFVRGDNCGCCLRRCRPAEGLDHQRPVPEVRWHDSATRRPGSRAASAKSPA